MGPGRLLATDTAPTIKTWGGVAGECESRAVAMHKHDRSPQWLRLAADEMPCYPLAHEQLIALGL